MRFPLVAAVVLASISTVALAAEPITATPPAPSAMQARPSVAQTQPQAAQASPCERSATQLSIGGVDMDESRCRDAIIGGIMKKMSAEITDEKITEADLAAKLALAQSDLQRARTAAQTNDALLTWYKSYVEGVEAKAKK